MDHLQHNGAFMEANIFIAYSWRTRAPTFVTANRSADQAGLGGGVDIADAHVAALHGDVEVYQDVSAIGIANQPQAFFGQVVGNSVLDPVAQDVIFSLAFAADGFWAAAAADDVAGGNRAGV